MSEHKNRKTKVMIIEDEEDILTLFNDYLSSRGHHVVCCCRNANHIVTNFETSEPDICLIDYILGGKSNGIDAAIQILKKSPLMPVLFVTAHESMAKELHKHPTLEGKNIQVLMKPVRMHELEDSMLSILNKNGH
jgi:DNA-binding NtrC family response regulator